MGAILWNKHPFIFNSQETERKKAIAVMLLARN